MRKLITLAVWLTLGVLIQADDAAPVFKARVDISSKDVALKPVSGPEGGSSGNIFWGKEELRKFNLTRETAQLPADQWIKATFAFIPESDGQG